MKITFQMKTEGSNVGNCPARYIAAEGGYVIQGKKLDGPTRAQLRDLGFDEDAVWVPADVVESATGS